MVLDPRRSRNWLLDLGFTGRLNGVGVRLGTQGSLTNENETQKTPIAPASFRSVSGQSQVRSRFPLAGSVRPRDRD